MFCMGGLEYSCRPWWSVASQEDHLNQEVMVNGSGELSKAVEGA